jgi:hypothetical protein
VSGVSSRLSPPDVLPGTPTVKLRIAVDPLIDQVTIPVLSAARADWVANTPANPASTAVRIALFR